MEFLRMFNPASEGYGDLLLLHGASGEAVEACLRRSRVLRAAPGELILEGDTTNATVYVVLSGTLRVDVVDSGQKPGYTHIARGECVGELSVIDGARTSAAVRAVDECELLALAGADVLQLADLSHAVARALLRLLSTRIRGANRLVREQATESEALRFRMLTDPLTGLYNRRWLDEMLSRMAERAAHGGRASDAFALLLIDVDHFKQVNDRFGHLVGDRMLRRVSEAIRLALRPTDFAARYGGEEMVAVLPGVADEDTALRVAERVREAVSQAGVPATDGHTVCVTLSIGVAVQDGHEQPEALLARADRALYHAKNNGRNRTAPFSALGLAATAHAVSS